MSNNAGILGSIKQKWAGLKPGAKQKFLISGVVGLIAIGGLFLDSSTDKTKKPVKVSSEMAKPLSVDKSFLERTVTTQTAKQDLDISDLRKKIDQLEKNGIKSTPATSSPQITPAMQQPLAKPLPVNPKITTSKALLPPPPIPTTVEHRVAPSTGYVVPPPNNVVPNNSPINMHQNVQGHAPRTDAGDIEIVSNTKSDEKKVSDKKKEKKSVYLPISFMEGNLISGLNAPTAEGARGNPVPVLIRVKKPAILPNEVKANLKGCFIVAEGVGNLSDERAHLRLVSLSCISKSGESVIDQKIKGFVVDADGKLGLSGRVVSKMGAVLARSLIAGFFGGVGDAMKQSTQTTTVSPLGSTSTPNMNAGDIMMAGVGSGVSGAAKELQKFYLDLAKQSLPVIEIGATKKITLVIQEGVPLEIKNIRTVPSN